MERKLDKLTEEKQALKNYQTIQILQESRLDSFKGDAGHYNQIRLKEIAQVPVLGGRQFIIKNDSSRIQLYTERLQFL